MFNYYSYMVGVFTNSPPETLKYFFDATINDDIGLDAFFLYILRNKEGEERTLLLSLLSVSSFSEVQEMVTSEEMAIGAARLLRECYEAFYDYLNLSGQYLTEYIDNGNEFQDD